MMTATKTLQDMFISGYVTLGNDSGNLCRNGATKLREKLQETLPSVKAPLGGSEPFQVCNWFSTCTTSWEKGKSNLDKWG